MSFKKYKGKYKVRCGICSGFYTPNNYSDEKYLVCYDCKASEDENIKERIRMHFFKNKTKGGFN